MIKAENLFRKFKSGDTEIVALKGVSLEVKEGDFISIIGRSGSGKSTLLYQLSLLDHPSSGTVYIDGVDTALLTPEERTSFRLRDLGYVFQDYALVPELNAIENVIIPLLMQGMEDAEARKIGMDVLERVGLAHRAKNLPNQLSGGEQQRVSIARAIAHNPKILFADEPTANLDNDTSLTILEVFKSLHRAGQTIIMVTHEEEYTRFSNRVITLFDGNITKEVEQKVQM